MIKDGVVNELKEKFSNLGKQYLIEQKQEDEKLRIYGAPRIVTDVIATKPPTAFTPVEALVEPTIVDVKLAVGSTAPVAPTTKVEDTAPVGSTTTGGPTTTEEFKPKEAPKTTEEFKPIEKEIPPQKEINKPANTFKKQEDEKNQDTEEEVSTDSSKILISVIIGIISASATIGLLLGVPAFASLGIATSIGIASGIGLVVATITGVYQFSSSKESDVNDKDPQKKEYKKNKEMRNDIGMILHPIPPHVNGSNVDQKRMSNTNPIGLERLLNTGKEI